MKQPKHHDKKPPSPRELQVDTARDDNPTCCRQPSSSNQSNNTNNTQGSRKTPKTPSTLHSPGAGGILRTMMLLRGARGGSSQTNTNSQTKPQSWRRRSAHHHRSNSLNSESSWTVPDNESISSSVAYDEDYDFLDTIESNASFSPPEPKPRTVEAPPAAEAVAPPAPPRLAKSPPQTTKHRKSHSHDFSYYPAPPTRARAGSADGVGGVVLMTTTTASPLAATPPRGRTGSNMSDISMTYSDEGDEDGDRVHRLVPWGGSPNRARTQSLEEFNASLAPQPTRARTHSDYSTRSAPVAAASSANRKRGTLHDTTPTRRPSRSTPLVWTPPPPSHY